MGSIERRRTTQQRRLLLDLIYRAQGHLDADEIYRQAKEKEARISLATIYRNLKLFKELGLVEERRLGEEHHRYEVKSSTEHHHLVCLGCGQIVEFESPIIGQVATKVQHENNFDITSNELKLEGYCRRCQERES